MVLGGDDGVRGEAAGGAEVGGGHPALLLHLLALLLQHGRVLRVPEVLLVQVGADVLLDDVQGQLDGLALLAGVELAPVHHGVLDLLVLVEEERLLGLLPAQVRRLLHRLLRPEAWCNGAGMYNAKRNQT